MTPERVLTGYRLNIDAATKRLLHDQIIESPNLVGGAARVTAWGLEYVVSWDRENEYVHKALLRALRAAIKSAKAAEREAT